MFRCALDEREQALQTIRVLGAQTSYPILCENPCGPVAPAIANAVEDAVGARIKDLPIYAEKVRRALAETLGDLGKK